MKYWDDVVLQYQAPPDMYHARLQAFDQQAQAGMRWVIVGEQPWTSISGHDGANPFRVWDLLSILDGIRWRQACHLGHVEPGQLVMDFWAAAIVPRGNRIRTVRNEEAGLGVSS
ncbi:hypothetical protein DL546_007611 [Coniochaeta pulveracea]|uniref:Uncharacterized protein n=1 Tax=Coniochaeta pulveracea TaxID=177199 RepID=A0A420YK89_9PEZI|nr:hypothetical protein DL546_007611 [Coniochaeta pulveracea]